MDKYIVEMSFKRPPSLSITVRAADKKVASMMGAQEAQRGGFGSPKKTKVIKLEGGND